MTPTDRPAPPTPPYAAPRVTPFGTIASVTAGADDAGNVDMVVGGTGGYVLDDDATS